MFRVRSVTDLQPGTAKVLLIRVIRRQLAVVATGSLVALWLNPASALIALMGGVIALMAGLVFGLISLILVRGRSAGAVVVAFYLGEVGKFATVVAGFLLVFRYFASELTSLNALLFLGVFAATLAVQWTVPAANSAKH